MSETSVAEQKGLTLETRRQSALASIKELRALLQNISNESLASREKAVQKHKGIIAEMDGGDRDEVSAFLETLHRVRAEVEQDFYRKTWSLGLDITRVMYGSAETDAALEALDTERTTGN